MQQHSIGGGMSDEDERPQNMMNMMVRAGGDQGMRQQRGPPQMDRSSHMEGRSMDSPSRVCIVYYI